MTDAERHAQATDRIVRSVLIESLERDAQTLELLEGTEEISVTVGEMVTSVWVDGFPEAKAVAERIREAVRELRRGV